MDRETNGTGKAEDLTLAELKGLRKRYRDGSMSSEPVATLEELLVAGKGRILFKPDLKPGMIDHFDELARLVSKLGVRMFHTNTPDETLEYLVENGWR